LKKFYYLFIALGLLTNPLSNISAQTDADFNTISGRLISNSLGANVSDATVASYIGTIWDNNVGRWNDINYAIVSPQPGFTTDQYFIRLQNLCVAYSKSGTYYHSAAVMNVINKALAYFYANSTMFNNGAGGYFKDLGYPGWITTSILIVQNDMDQTIKNNVMTYIKNLQIASYWNTGFNLGVVSNWILNEGCILKDASLVSKAVNNIASLMNITSGNTDGFKVDGSYFQHAMIYNGGYAAWLIPGIVSYPELIKGTYFDKSFPIQALGDYILNGQYWFTFRTYGEIGTRGRNTGPGTLSNDLCTSSMLDKMKAIDPSRATQYDAYKQHQDNSAAFTKPGNKHFFSADMMVHRGANEYMSVKTISNRTIGIEIGNYMNLKGYYMPLGMTQMLVLGNEYNDIMAVWDWTRLPGVTASLGNLPMPTSNGNFWTLTGTNVFGGGVSDGQNGIQTFSEDYNNLQAKKSYFFLGNVMVCLGAGIASTNTQNPVTSVNQCLSMRNVTLNNAGTVSTYTGTSTTYTNTLQWVHHSNIGYYFPPQTATITVKNDNQTGYWNDFYQTSNTALITSKVFSIWFDHGNKPTSTASGNYQYFVYPNISAADFQTWATSGNTYAVLSNTKDIQAVRNSALDLYGVVFYSAGSIALDNGLTLTVDRPAIVMLRGKNAAGQILKVSIEDPTYSANIINYSLKVTGRTVAAVSKTISLPTGNYVGSTVTSDFAIDQISAVENVEDNMKLTAYPNPSKDKFTITVSENISKIVVSDLTGKQVDVIQKSYLAGDKLQLGQNLKQGVYILTLTNTTGKLGKIKLTKE
jgi:chondroitin AC lyase